MSAIREEGGDHEPIQVLFALYENCDALSFTGTLEVLSRALHNINDPDSKAFECTFVGPEQHVLTTSGASFRAHMSYKEAHNDLDDYDILVIPGGKALDVISKNAEPLDLIEAYTELQEKDTQKERTIVGVDTGAMLLAKGQILQGLACTTHPDYYIKLENLCQEAAAKDVGDRTDVMEGERYVVNNARFDLGDSLEDNPYVSRKGRRASSARKGSMARKMSMSSREAIKRRAEARLGGMRVITTAGSTSGLDAALYLVSAMVSMDAAQEVARVMQFGWKKGVVVDAVDI